MERVAGIVIHLPSLQDRGNDVVILARHFAACEGLGLDERAALVLARRDCPGNVRELKWTVVRCALFATTDTIDISAVQTAMG